MFHRRNIPVSFEVYPPNTLQGFRNLRDTCQQLNALSPDFFSVTFGAGGATQIKTQRVVRQLRGKGIPTVPHLSCVNMNKERLKPLLQQYMDFGVERLVVIRGDFPSDHSVSCHEFRYASELIDSIRILTGDHFHISVAAYPEFHPESQNCDEDLLNFKHKVDAGANSAITQFFFSSDAYFRFKESCQALGITIPIIAGIMPILDYEKLVRFAKMCGAEIPLWLRKRLEILSADSYSFREFGIDVVTRLCEQLLRQGVDGLHFYVLNQAAPVQTIYSNLFVAENEVEKLLSVHLI